MAYKDGIESLFTHGAIARDATNNLQIVQNNILTLNKSRDYRVKNLHEGLPPMYRFCLKKIT